MPSKVLLDDMDKQVLNLINDTRLQQTLILHIEGKSTQEIVNEVGSTVAKNALSLLNTGRGGKGATAEAMVESVNTYMENGLSKQVAIASTAEDYNLQYLTVERAYRKNSK